MTCTSDRPRFIPARLSGVLALTVVLVVATSGTFATLPLLASEPAATPEASASPYKLRVSIFPAIGGSVRLVIAIATPSSGLLTTEATVPEGRPSTFETTHDNRTLKVDIPSVSLGQKASLEVLEDNAVLHRVTATIGASAALASKAEPISVNLKDADLSDFLKTLSEITGREIRLDPTITGKVSINAVDMPWDMALINAIAPLDLQVVPEGDALRIVRRGIRYVAPPPPPGYERVGGDVKAPIVVSRVEPMYPVDARVQRIAGIVIVQVLIDEHGTVKDAQIIKDLPFGLGQAAANAVRQWTFKPGTRDGKPVPVVFNLTVNFKLDTANAPPQ